MNPVELLAERNRYREALREAQLYLAAALSGHEEAGTHVFRRGEVADLEAALFTITGALGDA